MQRYLLRVLVVFLLEALLLALLQDRPALAPYLPKPDRALTYAFFAAWPLGLIVWLWRRRSAKAATRGKARTRKPAKRKKKNGTKRSVDRS